MPRLDLESGFRRPSLDPMALHMLARRTVNQSSVMLRKMSSKGYIIPVDPKNPAGNAAPGVDPASMWASLPQVQKPAKVGTSHLFYGTPKQDVTTLVSLGDGSESKTGDARREIVRKAIGSGVKSVNGLGDGISETVVHASADPHVSVRYSLK